LCFLAPTAFKVCSAWGPMVRSARGPKFETHEELVRSAWDSKFETHKELVLDLEMRNLLTDERAKEAMLSTDRAKYILPNRRKNAYIDHPDQIDHNTTISAPHMHAAALNAIASKLIPGSRVLDVGVGSGYLAAVIAKMLDLIHNPESLVVGIDHVVSLVELAAENCKRAEPEIFKQPNFILLHGDGWKGVPQYAPYDAIHVGAAAETVPQPLLQQLAPGGIMVIPIGAHGGAQVFMRYSKDSNGGITKKKTFGCHICTYGSQR